VPTGFTGYSFHLAEAALVFANEIAVCFLLPIHIGLHRAYHLYMTVIHIGAGGLQTPACGARRPQLQPAAARAPC
jgi:hypothetical protein